MKIPLKKKYTEPKISEKHSKKGTGGSMKKKEKPCPGSKIRSKGKGRGTGKGKGKGPIGKPGG
jgi:hypothetical protein